jgi:NAD(P)-dependent dehydrogenase (short-subunit alcohol dehydrogenase family)
MERSIVVTGASTGIGRGIAGVLVRRGLHVFGTVRKQSDADSLRAEFGAKLTPLLMDVTDAGGVARAAAQVRDALGRENLAGLVNNAGVAVVGPLLHLPLPEFRRQLEVNLIAPLLVTQAFAPLLGTDRTRTGRPGRIINISSVGGRMGAPFLGAYAASKHGLEGMSESLRREMMIYGIDVIVVEPGYVNTPILDKAESEDLGIYRHTDYATTLDRFRKLFIEEGRQGLPPQAIGEAVHSALTVTRPSVNYLVVRQKFRNWTIPSHLPKRLLDRLIGKRIGLLPRGTQGGEARLAASDPAVTH